MIMILNATPSAYISASNETPTHDQVEQKKSKENYRNCLLEGLERDYNDKAISIFRRVYPAFNAALETHFETIPDPASALQPLIDHIKLLDEIAEKLATGALVLDRTKILEKYPQLKAALEQPSTLLKQTFENILSKAWISKKLNDFSSYQAGSFEKDVLFSLGFKPSDDKQFLRTELQKAYSKNQLPSLEDLPGDFKKRAFFIRAISAGVPENAVLNLEKFLELYHKKMLELFKQAAELRQNFKVHDHVWMLFHNQNIALIQQHFLKFLELNNIRAKLSSNNFDDFLNSLPPLSKGLRLLKKLEGTIRMAQDWFKKYKDEIISEFSQGANGSDEMLGRGICLGLSFRMAKEALENPEEGAAISKNEPSDRVIQSYHDFHDSEFLEKRGNKTVQEGLILPREILKKKGWKEKRIFKAEGDLYIKQRLIENLLNLKESNGGIILFWGGHVTFMRFDSQRNQFLFFDSNYCTLKFEKKSGETPKALATRMATAYIELNQWDHPADRGYMRAYQIIPMKAEEGKKR